MKIRALSADTGGCHFYRIRTPLTAARRAGHDVAWGTEVTADELNTADVLIAQFLNGPDDLEGWLRIAEAPRRPALVYEVDDDLFTIDQMVTPEVAGGKPVLWGQPDTQERVKRFLSSVDLVTTTTPYLAQLYERHGARRTAVIPNALPDWVLDVPVPTFEGPFTVGWTLSHSHLLDARSFVPHLDTFMTSTDAVFGWIGPRNLIGGYPRQWSAPWIGDVNEYLRWMFGRLSVGIAPLKPGKFNRGKSGIKADEYNAFGIPCVVSDFPQYRAVVEHGVNGWLSREHSGFAPYLQRLYNDPSLAVSMGKAGRELVSTRVISKIVPQWINAWQEAIDARR